MNNDLLVYRAIQKPIRGEDISAERVHFNRWHLASVMEGRELVKRDGFRNLNSDEPEEDVSAAYLQDTQITVDAILRANAAIEAVIGPVGPPTVEDE